MSATKASVAKRVLRKPAKAVALAVGPKLGPRALHGLLAAATRAGLGQRASAALVRTAEMRMDEPGRRTRSGARMYRALAHEPLLSGDQRARLHTALGRSALASGDAAGAVESFIEALAVRPGMPRRLAVIGAAAAAGDRDAFYAHLTREAEAALARPDRAELLGTLGCSAARADDFPAAADAYHHAMSVQPKNRAWKDGYLRCRRDAPDWGFTSRDPRRAWRIADIPGLATSGVVAPIDRAVFGWLPASSPDTEVTFKVNGIAVATSRATTPVTLPDGGRYLQFSRGLKHLWRYCGAGDTLTVEAGGRTIPIIDTGDSFSFTRKRGRSEELLAKIDEGYVIDKYGSLKPSIQDNKDWQAGILGLYAKLRQDLESGMGLSLIPFYGTMLGAVREQNFIGHDNDFDCVYFSAHSEPDRVKQEFKAVCSFLLHRGYELLVKPTLTWVKVPGTEDKLDIFYGWFDADGTFDVSNGYHGAPVTKSDEFFELRTEKLGHFEVPVPNNAEDLLVQLYGPTWRTPDPGFAHYAATRKVDNRFRLSEADVIELRSRSSGETTSPHRASPGEKPDEGEA